MIHEKVISTGIYQRLWVLANLLFILIWYLSNQGLSFWDDFTYLNFANELNQGNFEITTNHFTSRITMIYPTAYVVKFLGINAYTIVLFPLLCTLGLLNLFFVLGQRINRLIGVIGSVLILGDYHLIHFSNHLFPELPMTLLVFLSLAGYYLVLKQEVVQRLAGLLCALSLFLAFLTKTTVVLVLPLWLFLFVNDRLRKQNGSFWLSFVFLSLFFFVLNGIWYYEVKGHFFYRFQNIANNHVASATTFFDKDGLTLLQRLTYLPFQGFMRGGFFIPLLLAAPAIFRLRKAHFSLKDPDRLWPIASLFLLLAFWFMSTSWRYYSPMPTQNRHIVFFIPVFIMTAATYWPQRDVFARLKSRVFRLAVIGAFLCIPAYAVLQANRKNFKDEAYLVEKYLVRDVSAQYVLTDGLVTYGHNYYYGFQPHDDEYAWFSETGFFELPLRERGNVIYVLTNKARFNENYKDSRNYDLFMENFKNTGLALKLIEQKGEVTLFTVTRP